MQLVWMVEIKVAKSNFKSKPLNIKSEKKNKGKKVKKVK